MMAWRHSITLRLTLLFALASTAVLLTVGILIGIVVESHFEQQDLAELRGKFELTRHALAKVHTADDLKALPQQLADALIGHPGLFVTVIKPDNQILYATANADIPAALLDKIPAGVSAVPPKPIIWEGNGHTYSGIAVSVATGLADSPPFSVAISLDIEHRQQFMQVFERTLWILFVLGIALSAVFGWFAAHQGLAPVRRIAMVAKGISASQLNDRLPLDTVPGELLDLAKSFNDMLSRLEDAFLRLSNFSSDLAHELRAPISNLMTQTQVTLSKTRTAEDYHEILASNLEEFDQLARMITDMLFLAKADHGLMVPQRDPIDLAAEMHQLIEFYEPLAEESGVRLEVRGQGTVVGDRLMIRRALSNLLSNALRHTERGGNIRIAIATSDNDQVFVNIENPGKEIAPNHIIHLFDRFYRIDPARAHSGEGAGLGLAITKSIVEAHRGRISVISGNGITRFELILPGAKHEVETTPPQ